MVRKDGQYYLKVYDGKLQLWLWSSRDGEDDGHDSVGGDDGGLVRRRTWR